MLFLWIVLGFAAICVLWTLSTLVTILVLRYRFSRIPEDQKPRLLSKWGMG